MLVSMSRRPDNRKHKVGTPPFIATHHNDSYLLTHKVELYISKGWDKNITDPENGRQSCNKVQKQNAKLQLPSGGRRVLKSGDSSGLAFCHGHMITYFVDCQVCDQRPAGDMRSISEHAYALSERGHVQKIEVASDTNSIYLRATCLPEMRKDRIYKISLELNKQSNHIIAAGCGCPAGKAPTASCKHIAALCYTLDKFCKHNELPVFLTCTDQLQSWNQPRLRKVKSVPVQELKFQKLEYGKKAAKYSKPLSSLFDPRPLVHRFQDSIAVKQMYEQLEQLGKPCGFLHLLGPVVDRAGSIRHDHTYAQTNDPSDQPVQRHELILSPESEYIQQPPTKEDMTHFKHSLLLTPKELEEVLDFSFQFSYLGFPL